MKTRLSNFFPLLVTTLMFASGAVLCAAAAAASAQATAAASSPPVSNKTARAHVDAAWVRAAPPGVDMLAGYMIVHNDGSTPLRLVSAHSDDFAMVELHRSLVANGMETMRPAGEQTIAPGASLAIVPGGLHWMLMQPRRELKVGDRVGFRLVFADGSSVAAVALVSAAPPANAAH